MGRAAPPSIHNPDGGGGCVCRENLQCDHFQQNIEQQKLLKGGKNADPFVIAKAATEGRAVVTMEQLRPNAVKIPNICQHFGIKCLSLEEFMEEEGWQF